jgi:hypothetical protein
MLSVVLGACGGGGGGGSSSGDGDGSGAGNKKLFVKGTAQGRVQESYRYDNLNRVIEHVADHTGVPIRTRKVEYTGADPRPSLVANEGIAGIAPFTQYSYGEDTYRGVTTKYFQTRDLDWNKYPISDHFFRVYLDSQNRMIAMGVYYYGTFTSSGLSFNYDSRGNLTKILLNSGSANEESWEFTYDNKNGAYSATETPFWWWQGTVGPNNVTSAVYTARSNYAVAVQKRRTYSYTYDSAGYPIQNFGSGDEMVGDYGAYEGTFEYIAAH